MRIGWWLLAAGLSLLIISVVVNLASEQGFQPPNRILIRPLTAGDIATVITSVSGLVAAVAGLITAVTGLMKARRDAGQRRDAADT
jgi:hypothetical protein